MTTNKKSGLGRGLSALLDSNTTSQASSSKSNKDIIPDAGSISEIEIAKIEVNPFQPRTQFDQQALEELSDSIKTLGLIQPITVRQLGYGKYQLISGERRFRASQLAGLTQVPAYVRIANDQQMLEMALVENIQRENLDPVEIALSYQRLIDECKLTQEELSSRVGKQRSTISNYLRLLKLPAEIQVALRKNLLTMGHARTLINIENAETQLTIFEDILKADLSVRQVEELVKGVKEKVKPKKGKPEVTPLSYNIQKLKNDLTQHLNSKIEIKHQNNGKGSIIINFNSDTDLERIVKTIHSK